MANSYIITGLDVGTTKICAVIAEVGEGIRPNVIGFGISPCSGLKKGLVVDLEVTTAAIRDALRKAERMADEEVHSVVVGVTGEHIASLNSKNVIAISQPGREVNNDDIERLITNARSIVIPPDREILHTIPRLYSVDGQTGIRSLIGMHANRLEVETHIVTGLSSFIQNVVKCVHQAGLTVDATVLEPIATAESVLLDSEKEIGAAVIDIGGGTSDLAVYIDGQIFYSGAIPIGGGHVTKDISIGLRTDVVEAERIKLKYGCVTDDPENQAAFEVTVLGSEEPRLLPQKILSEIIEPRMSEICQFVLEHIESSGCRDLIPAGLVFTGGGSLVPGFKELASEMTGLPVRIGKPSGVTGMIESISEPMYSTAIGLVLYGNRHREKHAPEFSVHEFIQNTVIKFKEIISKLFAGIRGD
ncbi:MAG: cell division protein FtsA [Armatimonadota bacterium]